MKIRFLVYLAIPIATWALRPDAHNLGACVFWIIVAEFIFRVVRYNIKNERAEQIMKPGS